jgi:hypothetical protein
VFLPERRTMPQVGIPLENQWSRWPGVTYQLPVQCWVGPHHSAVITGIARAGIDALIEPPAARRRAGAPVRCCAKTPQVRDAVGRARRDPQRRARLPQRDDRRAVEPVASGEETARPLPARRGLRRRLRARGDGFDVPAWRQYVIQRESRLAECWRDLHTVGQTVTLAPGWYAIGGRVYLGMEPGPRLR